MDDSETLLRRLSPSEIIRQAKENPSPPRMPPRDRANPPGPAEHDTPHDGPESYDPDRQEYKAWGRASNKPLPSIRFIRKDGSEFGGAYHHIDTHYPGGCEFLPSAQDKGNVIRLRFAGASSSFTVTLEGRNLRRLWELLLGHLTPWVCEYPSDIDVFKEGVPVVKAIRFDVEK